MAEEKTKPKMELGLLTRKIVQGAADGIPKEQLIHYIKNKGGYDNMSKFEKALATKRKEPAWWEKTLDFVNQGTMTPEQWGNTAEALSGGLTMNFSNYLQAGIDMAASRLPGKKPMTYGQSFANVHKRKAEFFEESPATAMAAEGTGAVLPGVGLYGAVSKIPGLAVKAGQGLKNFAREMVTSMSTAGGQAAIMAGNEGRDMKTAAGYGMMWGGAMTPGVWGLRLIGRFGMRTWRRLNQKYNDHISIDENLANEEAAKIWKDNLRRDQQTPQSQEEALQQREALGTADETMGFELEGPKGKGAFRAATIQGDTTAVYAPLKLDQRQSTIRKRITGYFKDLLGFTDEATGGANVRTSLNKLSDELMNEAKDASQPYYLQTYNSPRIKSGKPGAGYTATGEGYGVAAEAPGYTGVEQPSIHDPGGLLADKIRVILSVLDDWGKGSSKTFYKKAKAQAKLELEDFSPEVKASAQMDDTLNPDDISFATIDSLKKHLDEIIRTEHPKSHFYALLNRRKNEMVKIADDLLLGHETKIYNQQKSEKQLLGLGETTSPAGGQVTPPVVDTPPVQSSYQKARNTYSSAYRMKKAVDDGRTFLDDKTDALDKIYELDQLNMTPGELLMFRASAFNSSAKRLEIKVSNPKGEVEGWLDPQTEMKLRWKGMIPDDENYSLFKGRMDTLQEEAFNNNFFKPTTGSQTAQLKEVLVPPNEAVQVADAMNRKNYPGLIEKLSPESQAQTTFTQDLIGDAGLAKGPQQIRASRQKFTTDQDKYLSDKMKRRAGLLARGSGFGAGGLSLLSPRDGPQ